MLCWELQGLGAAQNQRLAVCQAGDSACGIDSSSQVMSRASGMQCDLHPGPPSSIQLIVSEVSRWAFTNQNLLRAMWSSEIPQLSAVTLSTCLDVCSSLLLPALSSTMGLMSALLSLVVLLGSPCLSTTLTFSLPSFPMSRFWLGSCIQHNCATTSSSPLWQWTSH